MPLATDSSTPMHADPWFSRVFNFDFPVERLPIILERLRGAPDRAEMKLRGVDPATLTRRPPDGSWSIQEHVAHLHDLEALHLARLDELERGVTTLQAADLENKKTWGANHNARPIAEILREFRKGREELVKRFERWDPSKLGTSAMHPRLKRPMRVVDVAFFTAEHDDHHLTKVHELLHA